MLTFSEFINTYYWQLNVGDTPENIGQCTGLCEKWLDNLTLNQPHLFGNAKNLLANADPNKFVKVINDPTNYDQFPPVEAIMVFGEAWGNGYGHCGLVVAANGYRFCLFDQNNPLGSRPKLTNFPNYSGVLGWFYPKQ